MIPNRYRRARPYIYSREEITAIVAAAELASVYGVRGLTCSTLFGLIAATGLRVSEALNLDCDDVDFDQGVLTIRRGKLGSVRVIPLHATVIERLRNFIAERDRLLGRASQALFVNCQGDRFGISGAHCNFAHVWVNLREPAFLTPPSRDIKAINSGERHGSPRGEQAGEDRARPGGGG